MTSRANDRLRQVLSKIAPLELWNFSSSASGPKVCWRFFRANPEQLARFWSVVGSFQGRTEWHVTDDCLEPVAGRTFVEPFGVAPVSPAPRRAAAPHLGETDAAADILSLADEIEKQLGLVNLEPVSFSESMLTREGLRQSHGPFQDFEDGGQRLVYLIVDPDRVERLPTDADLRLHFDLLYGEPTAIFSDVLGTDLMHRDGRTMTDKEADQLQKRFPLFWKISEYYEDAYLSPEEAAALYQECVALESKVSSPEGVRGLDKTIRIAQWASAKHYGVLFEAP